MLWNKYGGQPLPVKKIKIRMKNIFFITVKNSKNQKDKRTKI